MKIIYNITNIFNLHEYDDGDDSVSSHDSMSVSTSSQSKRQQNPRQNWPLGCFSEQLMKNPKLKTDYTGYPLTNTILRPHSQVDKR